MIRALLLTCLLATAAEAVAVPQYVWVHPAVTDMYQITLLFTTGRPMEHFDRITGVTGLMPWTLSERDQAQVVAVLDRAGTASCDSLENDSRMWEVTRIDTTQSGGLKRGASRRVPYGALRCAALDAMKTLPDTSRVHYALRQLANIQPRPQPKTDTPLLTSSYLAIEKLRKRAALIKDADDLNSTRDWTRVGFAVWPARAPAGHGVRLVSGSLPALVDDPLAPTDVQVDSRVLREVIVHFLGRPEIEIAGNNPISESMRNGVVGWAGAVECDSLRERAWVVFGSHVQPAFGASLGRELTDYLSVRDRKASQAVSQALGEAPVARKLPPASLRGPLPFAIKITPTTGDDMARGMLVANVGAPDTLFREPFAPRPDADIPMRGQWYKVSVGERGMATIAAQLDQAAIDDGAPCDSLPQYPAWPPIWHVRFLGEDMRVAREFDVPVRVVRCRALERYDALGRNGDYELRSVLHTLVELGVDSWYAKEPYAAPPQRMAPEAQRQAFLNGPVDAVVLSLAGANPNASMLRLASSPVQASSRTTPDAVQLRTASMHAAVQAALTHPGFIAGMKRARSAVRGHPNAEIRVLVSYPGMARPVLRLISYVSPTDAAGIAKQIMAAVTETEAEAIRARVNGTDR